MKNVRLILFFSTFIAVFLGCNQTDQPHKHPVEKASMEMNVTPQAQDTMKKYEVQKTDEEWHKILTSSEYRILRNGGTELPYINDYYDNEKEGVYYCAACGQPLYTSKTQYHSGTGWPSFWAPIKKSAVQEKEDNSLFMTRTEIVCSRCGSHIGHVFEDGPEPTGLRYCMNSAAMDFVEMDLSKLDLKSLPIHEKMASDH